MKKNITINLFGNLYNIDEDAYQLLDNYLAGMKRYFGKQEGGEEIADDIEHRVAELLWEKKEQGIEAINIDHIKEIIGKIGNAEQIGGSEGESTGNDAQENNSGKSDFTQEFREQANKTGERLRDHFGGRRLYRDGMDKMLGGVCSGLAKYFNFGDPVFWRLAFALLFLWKGIGLIPYLILWLVVPEARTPEDRLRQEGKELTPENLNDRIISEQAQGTELPRSNGNGCLKALFFLLLLGPLFILLLFLLAFIPAMLGTTVGLFSLPFVIFDGMGSATELFGLCSWILWTGLAAMLIVIFLLIYGVIHLLRRNNGKRMSATAIAAYILLFLAALGWSGIVIYNGLYNATQNLAQSDAWSNMNIGVTVDDDNDNDSEYLQETGFQVVQNNTSRSTDVGQFMYSDSERYLDACNWDEPLLFTAEKCDTVSPGTYRLYALTRAENEGAYLYAMAGADSTQAEKHLAPIAVNDANGGPIWEWATGKTDAQKAGIPHPELLETQKEAIANFNNGQGSGWSYTLIENIQITEPTILRYGVTTDSNLTGVASKCSWMSATQFVLEKTN